MNKLNIQYVMLLVYEFAYIFPQMILEKQNKERTISFYSYISTWITEHIKMT